MKKFPSRPAEALLFGPADHTPTLVRSAFANIGKFLLSASCLLATSTLWADNPPVFSFSIESTAAPGGFVSKGIALDTSRNLYALDSVSNRVVKFDSSGNYLLQWAADGIGIASDSANNVYVAYGSNPAFVNKYTSSGAFVTNWTASPSNPPSYSAPFNVRAIATDARNNIYTAWDAFSGFGGAAGGRTSSS